MTVPWEILPALPESQFKAVRRRAIFECCKWDPQVGDVSILAPFAIRLTRETWSELAALAEELAKEVADAETELVGRTDHHAELAIPRPIRKALNRSIRPSRGAARLIRFDFHYTTEGWKISEANTDVPGGMNEASGFARIMASCYSDVAPAGDPVGQMVESICRETTSACGVAFAHATAYTDDIQVMKYIANGLEARGVKTYLVSPVHMAWQNGRARLQCDWAQGPVDCVVRFFPAEWLPNLPRMSPWQKFFLESSTPICNPATALLTQSKRFPLVWDKLATQLPTWRKCLPETRDPRHADWQRDDNWILKPAFGRVGEDIHMAGVTDAKSAKLIRRAAKWHPGEWVAQRRFESVAFEADGSERHLCIGVYTVDGRAAGAYGRIATRPLINALAQDVAILVENCRYCDHGGRDAAEAAEAPVTSSPAA